MLAHMAVFVLMLLPTSQTQGATGATQTIRVAFDQVLTGDPKNPYAWGRLDEAALGVWRGLGDYFIHRLNDAPGESARVLEQTAQQLLDGAKPTEIYGTKVRVFTGGEPAAPAYFVFVQFEMAAVSARSGLLLCVPDPKSRKYKVGTLLPILPDRELDATELRYRGKLRLLLYGVKRGSTRSNLDLALYEASADRIVLLWRREGLPHGQVRILDNQVELRWIHQPVYPFGYTLERFVQTETGLELVKTTRGVER